MFRKTPKTAMHRYIVQHNTCIKANNPSNTQLILLLRNKGKYTQLGSLSFRFFKIFASRNQTQFCPLLRNSKFYMIKRRTPPASLNVIFKLKLLPYPEWSCNWNKHYYVAWWNVPVWNKLMRIWYPHRESWSAMIPYAAIQIMTQYKNGYKIFHSMWPTHHIVGMPRCSCIILSNTSFQ